MAAVQQKNVKDLVPERFICPITHEIMADPVVDPEGHAYEKAAIEDWLAKETTSPLTRNELSLAALEPANSLREEIRSYLKEHSLLHLMNRTVPLSQASASGPPDQRISLSLNCTPQGPTPFNPSFQDEKGDLEEQFVQIKIEAPNSLQRTPVDVCCVIDVSGSMQIEASVQTKGGEIESNGLSILDIVQHAVKTVIKAMKDADRVSLVSFSDKATTVLPLTQMDERGKKKAEEALMKMTPSGCTNLWDGLYHGMETLRDRKQGNRLAACFLLTDGQPNVEPPRGHIPTLRKYRDQHSTLPCTINTFGFGYGIESKLLTELAFEGGGNYVFIPDGGFVGTAFVNSLANILSTLANGVEVLIETEGTQSKIRKLKENGRTLGGYPTQYGNWGATVQMGSLRYGQSRDLVVPLLVPQGTPPEKFLASVVVRYDHFTGEKGKVCFHGTPKPDDVAVQSELCRVMSVDVLKQANATAGKSLQEAQAILKVAIDFLSRSSASDEKAVGALLEDLVGQATEAFSKSEWYSRWGRHYIPSLLAAHATQLCTNFKDPGLQHFGGDLFQAIQDELDSIFLSIPPPVPVPYVSPYAHLSGAPVAAPAPRRSVNMASYHNYSNPCFAGICNVLMANGTRKQVQEIKKGDLVSAGTEGKEAEILCVLKTRIADSAPSLVCLPGGLLVTNYHPVRINKKWEFPINLAPSVPRLNTPFIYSFVMKSGHVMVIDGIECVGMGHHFTSDSVVAHPFFGSEKVVEMLKMMKGWGRGLIEFEDGPFLRSSVSQVVESIDLKKEVVPVAVC